MRGVCVALVVAVRSLQASKGDPRRDDMCTWGRSTADLLEVAALRATDGDAGEPARVGGIPGEGDGLNSDARLRVAGLGTAGYCDNTGCLDMNRDICHCDYSGCPSSCRVVTSRMQVEVGTTICRRCGADGRVWLGQRDLQLERATALARLGGDQDRGGVDVRGEGRVHRPDRAVIVRDQRPAPVGGGGDYDLCFGASSGSTSLQEV
jgi:hypothetical protein